MLDWWIRSITAAACFLSTLAALGCGRESVDEVQIRGSDSEVNLVQRLAEAFMETRPEVSIAVTGGGSGVGIASLLDSTTDIANSSRPMNAQERVLALRKGVEPVATLFATDALTVIVNAQNPVKELTLEQVGAIFSGKISSWEAVGGHAGPIVAYGRQSSSGTFSFFREAVVQGDYHDQVRALGGNAHIAQAVKADLGGIGYVAVGYLHAESNRGGLTALRIRESKETPAVDPLDRAMVLTGQYPIARPLFQFTNGTPTQVTRDFLQFELSAEGETILDEMGFYPLVDSWRPRNAHLAGGARP